MSIHQRSGRAWRRHDVARVKQVRSGYFCTQGCEEWDPRARARLLGLAAHTAARCSCWMCGNPRRDPKHPLTRQEQKAYLAQDERGE